MNRRSYGGIARAGIEFYASVIVIPPVESYGDGLLVIMLFADVGRIFHRESFVGLLAGVILIDDSIGYVSVSDQIAFVGSFVLIDERPQPRFVIGRLFGEDPHAKVVTSRIEIIDNDFQPHLIEDHPFDHDRRRVVACTPQRLHAPRLCTVVQVCERRQQAAQQVNDARLPHYQRKVVNDMSLPINLHLARDMRY